MREKNCVAASLFRDLRKQIIARFARGGFDRHIFSLCQRANVRQGEIKTDIIFSGKVFHKARIRSGRSAAQLVVEMANDQLVITKID